jgi:hypothetical protein
MGRRKREGNHSPPQKIKYYRIESEMKKMDTQTQNPTKQR